MSNKGVEVQLFQEDGTTPLASATNLKLAWFDTTDILGIPDANSCTYTATTDSSGWLKLNLENVSGLASGDTGFLLVYQLNGGDHRDSLVFASQLTLGSVTAGQDPAPAFTFVRNPDWPAQTAMVNGVEKFTGLIAVYDHEANFVAIKASGAYTVDWGDGTTPDNTASNTQTDHNYVYANVSGNPVGTSKAVAVTFTDAGDLVNRTAHGYQNGQVLNFATIVTTTGISVNTKYYVVNKNTNDFQVSTTLGGSAVALTTDGSGTVFIPEYRVAVVTLTPQGGSHLTDLSLQVLNSTSGLQIYSTPWLDIALNSSYLTSASIGAGYGTNTTTTILRSLTVVHLGENALQNFSYFFVNCVLLQSLPEFNTASGTNFSNLFYGCYELTTVPVFNTSSGTNFSNMFANCYALRSIPLFDTSAGTDFTAMFIVDNALVNVPLLNTGAGITFTSMFQTCQKLIHIPKFNTALGQTFTSMFMYCYGLITVPLLNVSSGLNFTQMFAYAQALRSIPQLDTSAGTNFSGMFAGCSNLESVPTLNTASGTNFSTMFSSCYLLKKAPPINTASGTNFSGMLQSCTSLEDVPLYKTSGGPLVGAFNGCIALKVVPLLDCSGGNVGSMFLNCPSLQSVPALNFSASTNSANVFAGNANLARSAVVGHATTHSYLNCKLSAAELDAIYTNLASVSGKTITVTGNYGTTGDTPSIATAKGWTVTG